MHPYTSLPPHHFWRKSISDLPWRDVGFAERPKFTLLPSQRLATAGSCFAQHISRHMARIGLAPHVAEPAHPIVQAFGAGPVLDSYGQFSARYGNLYTSRQCLELFRQAFGLMPVVEDFVEDDGRWFDLLRPSVPKTGFASLDEARSDRLYHLQCVRQMFEQVDVFVFTLGLTESWRNTAQGHTYPVCPGTVRGTYRAHEHHFHNLRCSEVVDDLQALVHEARAVNPGLKFIFTVSPEPLVATYPGDNVLVASGYSKAVLRAAAGEVADSHAHVAYFPSFEIISHPASFGQYLASDLREVTERGVSHVMGCFLKAYFPASHAAAQAAGGPAAALAQASAAAPAQAPAAQPDLPPVECDELFYGKHLSA